MFGENLYIRVGSRDQKVDSLLLNDMTQGIQKLWIGMGWNEVIGIRRGLLENKRVIMAADDQA